jgi:hypothetical protein
VSRVHLFELHEQPRFPAGWRDLLTEFLSFYASVFKPYVCVAPLLANALEQEGTPRIVDLCSGAGRPLLSLVPALQKLGFRDLEVILTDRFPNLDALESTSGPGAEVTYLTIPIDAADVPMDLEGFRTLFTSFHHFRPAAAKAILTNAVNNNEGVGVFEYTERNWLIWGLPTLLIPLFVWLCTPFMRPFRWRRLLWTYLVPIVPIVALWDGFVSNLRTYSVGELNDLIEQVADDRYEWQVGKRRSLGLSHVTYAIGTPRTSLNSSA